MELTTLNLPWSGRTHWSWWLLPARLLLQVHDELVLEVEPDALEATRNLVVTTMENAVQLSVPLVAETGVGANWMEAK